MFFSLVRFFYKHIACLMFVILIQTVIFAQPPILADRPDIARLQVLEEAKKYLGVPYRYGGTSAKGLDCSGLISLVFKNSINVSAPRTVRDLYPWTERIDTEDLQPGDLVFFNTTGGISHVGFYAGDGKFIHSASEGPRTGVIISSLDESYWKRTYFGAGRAISPIPQTASPALAASSHSEDNVSENDLYEENIAISAERNLKNDSKLHYSLGGALSWNNYVHETKVIRGAGFLIGMNYPFAIAGKNLSLGLELRPEWDIQLGAFRLPLTISFGGDMFRVFLGPVLSFGDTVLDVPEGKRYFDGGSSWIGEGGISFTPFTFNTKTGKLALYGELAWQFYHPKSNQNDNWIADLSAATRISTGVRYAFR
jgi:probable lipoprotein NlpC